MVMLLTSMNLFHAHVGIHELRVEMIAASRILNTWTPRYLYLNEEDVNTAVMTYLAWLPAYQDGKVKTQEMTQLMFSK